MNHMSPKSVSGDTPPITRRAMAKQRTRERLLGAARRLFAERGYEAATVRDIAAAADLSTGAVFASFADKAELFNEVIIADHEALAEVLRNTDAEKSTRATILKLFTLAYGLQMDQLRLVQAKLSFSWLRDAPAERRARQATSLIQRHMTDALRRGVECGELSHDTDIGLTSDILWATYIANYRQAIYDGWDMEALRARFSAQIDIVLSGVRAAA
jgi:AcrR family transcriptional regulator